jgi:3-phenylpropionate/trans-cinnamate dioxygenase ferredoxin subunit
MELIMPWIPVVSIDEIPENQFKEIVSDDYDLLLVHYQGKYYAIQNLCTHDGGNLSFGNLENDEIVCPRHGARFCIKTGAATCPPAYENIEAFSTRVNNGMVEVLINE